jgi:ADP-ribose pyrophosphatase YjhB (NUDIX family)
LKINQFNVRVYGLLINHKKQILLSDEQQEGFNFTKFPGGGLEFGEGLIDALKREFIEEMNLAINIQSHFYTTDFFVKSAFDESQLISVYYLVKPLTDFNFIFGKFPFDFEGQTENCKQCLRFVDIAELHDKDLTFPVDKHVVEMLKIYKIHSN